MNNPPNVVRWQEDYPAGWHCTNNEQRLIDDAISLSYCTYDILEYSSYSKSYILYYIQRIFQTIFSSRIFFLNRYSYSSTVFCLREITVKSIILHSDLSIASEMWKTNIENV